jgi:hypothetical protein
MGACGGWQSIFRRQSSCGGDSFLIPIAIETWHVRLSIRDGWKKSILPAASL